jgi:hypothetical protein
MNTVADNSRHCHSLGAAVVGGHVAFSLDQPAIGVSCRIRTMAAMSGEFAGYHGGFIGRLRLVIVIGAAVNLFIGPRIFCLLLLAFLCRLAPAQAVAEQRSGLAELLPAETIGCLRIRTDKLGEKGVRELLDKRFIDVDLSIYDVLSVPADLLDFEEFMVAILRPRQPPRSAPQSEQFLQETPAPIADPLRSPAPVPAQDDFAGQGEPYNEYVGPRELLITLVRGKTTVDRRKHLQELQRKVDKMFPYGSDGQPLNDPLQPQRIAGQQYYSNLHVATAFLSETQYIEGDPEAVKLVLQGMREKQQLSPPLLEVSRRDADFAGFYRFDQGTLAAINQRLPQKAGKLPLKGDAIFSVQLGTELKVDVQLTFSGPIEPATATAAVQLVLADEFGLSSPQEFGFSELLNFLNLEMVQAAVPPKALHDIVGTILRKEHRGSLKTEGNQVSYQLILPIDVNTTVTAAVEAVETYVAVMTDIIGAMDYFVGENNDSVVEFAEELKRIQVALSRYEQKHGHFPPPAICSDTGAPLLSWRVALLPYMGEEQLYGKFRLDEPWDSDHNLQVMQDSAKQNLYLSGYTYSTAFRLFTGEEAPFSDHRVLQSTDMDSRAQTALVVEAARQVIWTRPESLRLRKGYRLPVLGRKVFSEVLPTNKADNSGEPRIVLMLMADGKIRSVQTEQANPRAAAAFRSLFTSTAARQHVQSLGKILNPELKPRPLAPTYDDFPLPPAEAPTTPPAPIVDP